jgi:acylphosphatase
MRLARRYLVTGRVQGVGFRMFVSDRAAFEGLQGWVANRADGAVEILAEGEKEALERFERALWQGPRLARVDDVEMSDEPPAGIPGFSIR